MRLRTVVALVVRPVCMACFGLLYGTRTSNLTNLPRVGAVIVTPNHQTFLDGLLVEYRVARPITFMVGRRYWEHPVVGLLLRALRCIPVGDGPSGGASAYRAGTRALRKGGSVAIFPEGQRTFDGHLGRLHPGAARLAVSTATPIVPVSIVGAHEVWPPHRLLPRLRGPIIVKFHRPIRYEPSDGEDPRQAAAALTAEIDRVLRRRLEAWHRVKTRTTGRARP